MHIVPEPDHHHMLCPSCGSKNVTEEKDSEITTTNNIKNLKKYSCGDCKISFIPGVLLKPENTKSLDPINENINKWSKGVRRQEGNNQGRAWSNEKTEYLIIKKK